MLYTNELQIEGEIAKRFRPTKNALVYLYLFSGDEFGEKARSARTNTAKQHNPIPTATPCFIPNKAATNASPARENTTIIKPSQLRFSHPVKLLEEFILYLLKISLHYNHIKIICQIYS